MFLGTDCFLFVWGVLFVALTVSVRSRWLDTGM